MSELDDIDEARGPINHDPDQITSEELLAEMDEPRVAIRRESDPFSARQADDLANIRAIDQYDIACKRHIDTLDKQVERLSTELVQFRSASTEKVDGLLVKLENFNAAYHTLHERTINTTIATFLGFIAGAGGGGLISIGGSLIAEPRGKVMLAVGVLLIIWGLKEVGLATFMSKQRLINPPTYDPKPPPQ